MFLKSFCDSFFAPGWARSDKRNKTIQVVQSLKDGMDLIKEFSSPAKTPTTCAVDRLWSEKVNSYAKAVVGAQLRLHKPQSWEDRQGLHEAVAKELIKHLNGTWDSKR